MRKSRSTSTLDSANQPKTQKMEPTSSTSTPVPSTDGKKASSSKPQVVTTTAKAGAGEASGKGINQSVLPSDGKVVKTPSSTGVIEVTTEVRKKPVPPSSSVATKQGAAISQEGASLKPATASQVQSQNQANICVECNNSSGSANPPAVPVPKTPEQQQQSHVVTKRAAVDAASASTATSPPQSGSVTSSLSPASSTTSPNGPPLVPSQVRCLSSELFLVFLLPSSLLYLIFLNCCFFLVLSVCYLLVCFCPDNIKGELHLALVLWFLFLCNWMK